MYMFKHNHRNLRENVSKSIARVSPVFDIGINIAARRLKKITYNPLGLNSVGD